MEGTISEIRMFAGNFAPRNWAFCNGQILPINQNQALFSLIGTTYGGNGIQNFALPKFDGRIAMGTGNTAGVPAYQLGEVNGSESVTLTLGQMPAHMHMGTLQTAVPTYADNGDSAVPTGANLAAVPGMYAATANTTLKPFTATVTAQTTGSNQPINIMQPYLAMNYVICLYGIFPSRP